MPDLETGSKSFLQPIFLTTIFSPVTLIRATQGIAMEKSSRSCTAYCLMSSCYGCHARELGTCLAKPDYHAQIPSKLYENFPTGENEELCLE